jgi:hypothetical protein
MNQVDRVARKVTQGCLALQKAWIVWTLRDSSRQELTRLGTSYGGWTVPATAIAPGRIAICVGAGEDISFDVELNKRGMTVFTMDPTPRAKKHVQQVLDGIGGDSVVPINKSPIEHYDLVGFDPLRFRFLDLGLSDQDQITRFWAPKNPEHVSHSIVNLQRTEDFFEARCVRLETLCSMLKISSIEILKLNIEGEEYTVLQDLIAGDLRPRVICAVFDEGNVPLRGGYLRRISEMIKRMKRSGYRLLNVDGWSVLFVLGKTTDSGHNGSREL